MKPMARVAFTVSGQAVAHASIFMIFLCGSLLMAANPLALSEPGQYGWYVAMYALMAVPYIFLQRQQISPSWRVGAGAVFVVTVLSPVVLETDMFRYVWDGLNMAHGINPYRYAPVDHPWFDRVSWASNINHDNLPSIYPPVAQVFFALSTFLNPFLWFSTLDTLATWQVVFGLKLATAILAVGIVCLLRRRRWDLVVLHPLFLTQALGNLHVDVLVVFGMILLFEVTKPLWVSAAGLAFAILSKLYPLILLPLLYLSWRRQTSRRQAYKLTAGILASCAVLTLPLLLGANGGLFNATATYAQHWLFFGYIHGFLVDALNFLNYGHDAVNHARLLCLLLGGAWTMFLCWVFLKGRIEFRLAALFLFQGFFALSPTLHPWYLLVLLPLGLPYFAQLKSAWVWPLLSMAAFSFYINDWQDVASVRYLTYGLISGFWIRDLRVIFKGKPAIS